MSDGAETIDALRERLSSDACVLVVVAGPNGAGKTTFVETFLKTTGLRIVNPDQIARALSPDAPDM
jgi:predicted ABC-type ATPase